MILNKCLYPAVSVSGNGNMPGALENMILRLKDAKVHVLFIQHMQLISPIHSV